MPFDATSETSWAIPFAFEDYLEVVARRGRAIRSDKRGHIPPGHPEILDRLGIDPEQFVGYSECLLKAFGTAVGAPAAMANLVPGDKRYTCAASVRLAGCSFPSKRPEEYPNTLVQAFQRLHVPIHFSQQQ